MVEAKKVVLDEHELTSNTPVEAIRNWGFVSAKPSEYLVVYRGGVLDAGKSGQGARVFKWPSDSIALIPTTLKEVVFQANQLTADNVDVRIRGMVLYRVADPLRICRLINFTRRQEAEAKLARMLADLCRSSIKWLVANMPLDDCMRRRKDGIAAALKDQLSPVVSSDGPAGWGVEIVTIDVQDVFIQDAALFQAMQTRFRAEKEREAQLARLGVEQEVERRRLTVQRELEKDRHDLAVETARLASEAALAELQSRKKSDEARYQVDRSRAEQEQALELYRTQQQQEREELAAESMRQRLTIETDARRIANDETLRELRERVAVENSAGRASLERLFLSEGLPELARTLAASMEGARLHVYQSAGEGGAGPLGFALQEILGVLRERLETVPEAPSRTT